MSTDQKNKGFADKIWNLFSSIKLAVVVFSTISITSIVGTVIEQQAEPERNIKLLSKLFGDSFAPAAFSHIGCAGVYRYVPVMVVFGSSVYFCGKPGGLFQIERLPKILKVARERIRPLTPEQLNALPIKRRLF